MPDILLFGATGYTGRLTALALARRGASFAISGRSPSKLEAVATETGHPEIRTATVGDTASLVAALEGTKVLLTCVGPFEQWGHTAVEAALEAGVHYVDSTGEGTFIAGLIRERDAAARAAGIAMAPALAFDEVPADVAATLACEGMNRPELVLTYAVPTSASSGTVNSALGIISRPGPWIEDGETKWVRTGRYRRWAPLPPPLGPRPTVSAPLAELYLAPRHLDLRSLQLYMTSGRLQTLGMKVGLPVLSAALSVGPTQSAIRSVVKRVVPAPDPKEGGRRRFTILAEASSGRDRRNVVVTGADVYGLSAELLACGAMHMAEEGYDKTGVLAPVQAVDIDILQKELIDHGVLIEVHD
nr:saccharopine dehydrogenase NADP-binding domain-containing protein [Actinomycetota bacterium]